MIINPQIYADICHGGNIEALERHLAEGWDVKQTVAKSPGGTEYTPIKLAIDGSLRDTLEKSGVLPSIRWLTEHGAKLNDKKGAAFPTACRSCNEETIRYLAANGADVNALSVGGDAYTQAYYRYKSKKKMDIFELIQELGHSAAQYGGDAFYSAVREKSWEVIEFFTTNGVDVNYCTDDKLTPLWEAVMGNDLRMCQYLIEHGADLKKAAGCGRSMYHLALEMGHTELAEYFISLAPPGTYTLESKLFELKSFKLPKQLLDFLQNEQLRFELGEECEPDFIEFSPLIYAVQSKAKRQKILLISKELDGYDNIAIAWNPKTKKIAYWDCEHGEFGNVAPFEQFIENMGSYIQKILNGDYAEFSEWR